jgi:hypothetical protein
MKTNFFAALRQHHIVWERRKDLLQGLLCSFVWTSCMTWNNHFKLLLNWNERECWCRDSVPKGFGYAGGGAIMHTQGGLVLQLQRLSSFFLLSNVSHFALSSERNFSLLICLLDFINRNHIQKHNCQLVSHFKPLNHCPIVFRWFVHFEWCAYRLFSGKMSWLSERV